MFHNTRSLSAVFAAFHLGHHPLLVLILIRDKNRQQQIQKQVLRLWRQRAPPSLRMTLLGVGEREQVQSTKAGPSTPTAKMQKQVLDFAQDRLFDSGGKSAAFAQDDTSFGWVGENGQRQMQKQVPSTSLRTGSSTLAAKAPSSLRMTPLGVSYGRE